MGCFTENNLILLVALIVLCHILSVPFFYYYYFRLVQLAMWLCHIIGRESIWSFISSHGWCGKKTTIINLELFFLGPGRTVGAIRCHYDMKRRNEYVTFFRPFVVKLRNGFLNLYNFFFSFGTLLNFGARASSWVQWVRAGPHTRVYS